MFSPLLNVTHVLNPRLFSELSYFWIIRQHFPCLCCIFYNTQLNQKKQIMIFFLSFSFFWYSCSTKISRTALVAELRAPRIHEWLTLKCSPAKWTPHSIINIKLISKHNNELLIIKICTRNHCIDHEFELARSK